MIITSIFCFTVAVERTGQIRRTPSRRRVRLPYQDDSANLVPHCQCKTITQEHCVPILHFKKKN